MLEYYQILKREVDEKAIGKKKKTDISFSGLKKDKEEKNKEQTTLFSSNRIFNKQGAVWLSLSDAAKIGGIQIKTLRRAIRTSKIKYKIVRNRYLIDFKTLVRFLYSNKRLFNKFKLLGIGQYIKEWKNIRFS